MEYEFRYKLTQEEYENFYVYTGWEAPWLKPQRVRRYVVTFLYGLLYSWSIIIGIRSIEGKQPVTGVSNIIGTLAGAIIAVLLTNYSALNSLKKSMSRLLQEDDNKSMLEERVLMLQEESLIITYPDGMAKLKWSGIKQFVATKDVFYLITSSLTGYIIPKRILASQAEIDELERFLLQKISVSASFKSL